MQEQSFFHRHKRQIIDVLAILAAFFAVIVSYLVFKPLYRVHAISGGQDGFYSHMYIYISITIWVVVGLILWWKKKLNFKTAIFMLFILAVIVRINYMLMTPYNYRQHDTITDYGDGHADYARIIYNTWQLPDNNAYQFYHPPLNAFLQAVWMHISGGLLNFMNLLPFGLNYDMSNYYTLYETTEMLSCLYMIIVCYLAIRIFTSLKISNTAKMIGIIFVLFFPRLVQFAAQENNDPLVVLFSTFAIYYTFKWWENKSWFNTITIAVSVGLAMMSKLSGAIIAFVPAFAFIYDFVISIKNKEKVAFKNEKSMPRWTDLLLKYVSVLLIAGVLGFWFQFYALYRFGQPIGYVYPISTQSPQYRGNTSFFARFVSIFEFKDLFICRYGNTTINYNLFNFTVRSSMFGEFSFLNGDYLATFMTLINYLFVVVATITFIVYLCISGKEHWKTKWIAGITILALYISQIIFNIKCPFGCTMDFRYIVPIIFGYALFLSLSFDKMFHNKGITGILSKASTILGMLMIGGTTLFYLIVI